MQASDTYDCTMQMTMYRENQLLAQAHVYLRNFIGKAHNQNFDSWGVKWGGVNIAEERW